MTATWKKVLLEGDAEAEVEAAAIVDMSGGLKVNVIEEHTVQNGISLRTAGAGVGAEVESTNAGAMGAAFAGYHNSASPADEDAIATIRAFGKNDAATPEKIEFGKLVVVAEDVSDGTEDGRLDIYLMKAGTLTKVAAIGQDGSVRADVVSELTPATGVTIDGVLIKDGLVDGKDVSTLGTGGGAGEGASAYHAGSAQSIANDTGTNINLDSELWDNDTCHDNSTNNERLTCKTAGKYIIEGWAVLAGVGNNVVKCNVRKNGSDMVAQGTFGPPDGNNDRIFHVFGIADLAVSDYVTFRVYHTAGSAKSLGTGEDAPRFAMIRVG